MIHRMQFNQLNSLMQSSNSSADTNLQQSWFIELPVMSPHQQVNTFNLRVDKEKHSQHQDPSDEEKVFSWKLLLSFDLDELGPIYVQVKLQDKTINSVLWADRSETLTLLKQETPRFKSSLESIGLQVNELHCMQGQPPNTATKLDRHLVDTKA